MNTEPEPSHIVSCIWHSADQQARSMLEARPCHADADGERLFEPAVARLAAGVSWIAVRGGDLAGATLRFDEGATILEQIDHSAGGFTLFVAASEDRAASLVVRDAMPSAAIEIDSSLVRTGLADALRSAESEQLRATMAGLLLAAIGDARPDWGGLDALDAAQVIDLLIVCAQILRRLGRHGAEVDIQRQRLVRAPSAHARLQLARALLRAGDHAGAAREADRIDAPLDPVDAGWLARLRDEVEGRRKIAAALRDIGVAALPSRSTGRIAYCLHNALPYASGGYAARSHGLARALLEAGHDIVALARPGFPSDSPLDAGMADERRSIDGVEYHFHNGFGRRGRLYGYLAEAADYYEDRFRALDIGLVHAATNYLTALPAGIAARRLGLRFVYEVRSFWNLSREAKSFGAAETAEARRDDLLEQATLALADRVVTLTGAMREHLAGLGVAPGDVDIVPNAVDPERWAPRARDPDLMAAYGLGPDDVVIGYAGAMLGYEGLDMLAEAAAPILTADPRVRLLIVGADAAKIGRPGTIEHGLAARMAGLGVRATLASRVPHDRIAEVEALFDICAYPRLPLPVCELISPLKPLEAMAMGKAVVASSVGGMREMVRDGETGLVFAKGDAGALSAALARLVAEAGLRARLGEGARAFVERERSWAQAAGLMRASYEAQARGDTDARRAALDEALAGLFGDV